MSRLEGTRPPLHGQGEWRYHFPMHLEALFDVGLSLLFVFWAIWYVVKLDRQFGKPGWDWFTILLATVAVGLVCVVLFLGRR